MRRFAIHLLFFVSGVSALIYEIVWQRLLYLVFGVSTLSVSAVLAALMTGLALGGWLFGGWADRTRRPLRLYAGLELGIALTALLVAPAVGAMLHVYEAASGLLTATPWAAAGLRFLAGFLILVAPATLMGGTLPVMGRLTVAEATSLTQTFSWLYAVNTLGGVCGAALTGFALLPSLGMKAALLIGASVNGIVALSAAWLARGDAAAEMQDAIPASAKGESSRLPWFALSASAITGAVCMGLEVAWTRVLGILTSNSAYGFALILSVVLLGLGFGSFLQAFWSRRPGDNWRRLTLCQWLLAGLTVTTTTFFRTAPAWLVHWSDTGSAGPLFLGEFLLTAAALLIPATLMGMSLPLLVAGLTDDPARFGKGLGRLYAVNYLGCAAGAVLTGLVLVPGLGIHATFGILALGSFGVGLVAWLELRPVTRPRLALGATAFAAGAVAWLVLPGTPYQKSQIAGLRELRYYAEGNSATVSVVREPNGTQSILVDGQPVAGTAASSVADQKMLAHLPLLLHPDPKRALTVGFGSGGTSYSMTLHGIDVDCVEIEAAVPAAAEQFVSENHGVRAHPRYRLILDDARSWLRLAPVRYDAIVTDCTNLQYRSNGDLYTVEYFRLMQERLTPSGIGAAWIPANGIAEADLKTLLRSFRAVFPHTSIWHMNTLPTDFLILIGTPAEMSIDMARLRARMARPEVATDLAVVGLQEPARLVCTLLAAGPKLDAYLEGGPLNTDDQPVLSYSTYGANYRSTIATNLLRLLALRPNPAVYVRNAQPEDHLLAHYAGTNELFLGHVALLAGSEGPAQEHYRRAQMLMPSPGTIVFSEPESLPPARPSPLMGGVEEATEPPAGR